MTNVDMHELQKISILIEHFKEHSTNQPKLTFLDLIEMHYGSGYPEEKPDKHSDNLPFQSHHCCNTVAFYVINFPDFPDFKVFSQETKTHAVYQIQFSSTPAGSIWQPPKFHI